MTSEVCHEYRAETADSLVTVYCLGVGQAPAALTGAELTLSMMSSGSVLSGPGPGFLESAKERGRKTLLQHNMHTMQYHDL